jgi:hypothetical protein
MSQSTMGSNPLRGDVARSEQVLKAIGDRMGLSDAGREAVIAAFDPFHDRKVNYQGWPDAEGRNSLPQVITISTQVSAPPGLTAGSNWDCHIIDWPLFGSLNAKNSVFTYSAAGSMNGDVPTANFQFVSNTPIAASSTIQGLGVYSYQSGGTNVSPLFSSPLQSQTIGPGIQDLQNPWRVTGKAFEVYNTSSELNKQGAVCIYKQPMPDLGSSSAGLISSPSNTPAQLMYADIMFMPGPPANVSEALRLPDSRQWKAEDGCYVINTPTRCDSPAHIATWQTPMWYNGSPGAGTAGYAGYGYNVQSVPTVTPTISAGTSSDNNWTYYNQTGAIFTGLNALSTLTINQRYFVEVFPTSSSALANFAHPSPQYDPAAMRLISELFELAPVGVEVKYNFLGEWFSDGIKSIAGAIGPVIQGAAKVIPDPRLKALAMASKAMTGSSKPKVQAQSKTNESKIVKKDEKKLAKDVAKLKVSKK